MKHWDWTSLVWEESAATEKARLVLLAIAKHANDKGEAFPGGALLARLTKLSEKSVSRAVQELSPWCLGRDGKKKCDGEPHELYEGAVARRMVHLGELAITRPSRSRGYRYTILLGPNRNRPLVHSGMDHWTDRDQTIGRLGSRPLDRSGSDHVDHSEGFNEGSNELSTELPGAPTCFDEFWSAYPKRVGDKAVVETIFDSKVASGVDPLQLVEAAKAYATFVAPQPKSQFRYWTGPRKFLENDTWRSFEPAESPATDTADNWRQAVEGCPEGCDSAGRVLVDGIARRCRNYEDHERAARPTARTQQRGAA